MGSRMFSLEGRKALVTGAGGGLGSAIAEALAIQGADVVLTDLDEAKAAAKVAAIGERLSDRTLVSLAMDVTSEESVRDTFVAATEHLGLIDVMVNVAGIAKIPAPARDVVRGVARNARDSSGRHLFGHSLRFARYAGAGLGPCHLCPLRSSPILVSPTKRTTALLRGGSTD